MNQESIEQWDMFEIRIDGPDSGNPFLEIQFKTVFTCEEISIEIIGFYDGNGVYKARFMPTKVGMWHYYTHSNNADLDKITGKFLCVEPSADNHGPVNVHNLYHFSYADGTPYYPFGTTCYAWTHQDNTLEEMTLRTLSQKPFNKIRMCVFPKYYPFNHNEPIYYPFLTTEDGKNDYTRFNPLFFQHFEERIKQLGKLGIEAEIIIWHPYDHWGYSQMDEESDYRYLRYLIARCAAFRNIWWSLANEYDFLLNVKPIERWAQFFKILKEEDVFQHLRSIHNGDPNMNYDHSKEEVTHVCIQNWDVKHIKEWRNTYKKPIINDELEYEGDIPFFWGNISTQEAIHRLWIMVVNGGYAGHGETYMHPKDILWWSKGGVLHGHSWKGFGFLREIIEAAPMSGLTPIADEITNGIFPPELTQWYWTRISGGMSAGYYLIYLGEHQMHTLPVWLDTVDYSIDIIDTQEMTISKGKLVPYDDTVMGINPFIENLKPTLQINIPAKPFLAIQIKKK